jgi:hypothetical protein
MSNFTSLHKIAYDMLDKHDDKASIIDKINCLFSPLTEDIHLIHYVGNDTLYSINIERKGWIASWLTGSKVKVIVKELKID